MNITTKGFLFFLGGFVYYLISLEYFILSIIKYLATPYILIFIFSILLSFILGGYIVDIYKNRMILILISSILVIFGIIFTFSDTESLQIGGLIIIFMASTVFIIDLHTILVHESTILNRGRLTSYLLFFSIIIATSILLTSILNLIAIIIILTIIVFINIFYILREYSYIESNERLSSDLSFRVYLSQDPINGYLFLFLILSIIVGYSFPSSFSLVINPFSLFIFILGFLIYIGVLLDNQGRKWSFTATLFTFTLLFLLEDLNFIINFYNEIFFGLSIPLVLVLIFTFSGDFSTKRNTIKYRGRILSIFLIILLSGITMGVIFKVFFSLLVTIFPEIVWFSTISKIFGFFLVIISLVRIMPLPEILSAKEADWAKTIQSIYIFNKDSICLFNKDYTTSSEDSEGICEDLVTSGLTGIMGLISEITNEQKNLRIIDKERVKIYFTYGKFVNIALISTKFLPILFKKMEIFMKAFEKHFEQDLKEFNGNINVFLEDTDEIIQKYFK
ncbi:MAG: hypothetical protein ACFFBP_17285 [Promethearchaeota archaeon]